MEERVTKKRASRACGHCRMRKVRCDVVTGGIPCTNCRLDSVSCKVAESARARRPHHPASISKSPVPGRQEPSRASSTSRAQSEEFPISLTFEDQMGWGSAGYGPDEDCHSTSGRITVFGLPQASRGLHPRLLPPYIKPLPPHIRVDDMEYLTRKHALTIPDDDLRNELLRYYIKIIHPSMPILDVNQFVTPILRSESNSPVSLLLFQAVMFVGVCFVEMGILRRHGYISRKSARKRFFNRVRLLYGLDCESDRLALLQSLLFMTFWYDAPEDEKDTWHWMGIALSMAQVLGIHRDPTNLRISIEAKRHRIRLWWACLMRDRLLALGIRRPARVRPDDCNVRMPTVDDFNIGVPSDELVTLLGESTLVNNQELSRTLAVICIEQVKLCMCIGHILLTQYSVLPSSSRDTGEYFNSVMVFPRDSGQQNEELDNCDRELEEWSRNLSADSRYTAHRASITSVDGQGDEEAVQILRLHQASLHMIYLTAQGILHRPRIFPGPSSSATDDSTRSVSRQKVTDAAIEISQLAYEMQLHDQTRYLSTSSIPAFVSASLIHLFDIRSTQEDVRNLSIGRFFQCMQALRQLQDMYASADYAVYFLESVIEKRGIQVPMLEISPSSDRRRPSKVSQHKAAEQITEQRVYPTSPSSFGNQATEGISPSSMPPPQANPVGCVLDLQADSTIPVAGSQALPADAREADIFAPFNTNPAGDPGSGWTEIDSLLCAFINFENSPGFVLSPTYDAYV